MHRAARFDRNWNEVWQWNISARVEVLELLEAVLPALIVKRELAAKAIADIRSRSQSVFIG
jgi:hypothetical protein